MARTCRTRRRPSRDLDGLARHLDAIAEELGWGGPPLLVGLTDDGVDELDRPFTIGPTRAPAAPDDLVAALVGFDAPPEWQAMAVVVHGRSWALDEPSDDPRPVRLTHVVDRGGEVASLVRRAGEEPQPMGRGGVGRLVDACRRCLGLPTAPPPSDSTALWALLWLDDLLARAARGEPAADPAEAARSHPAVAMVAEGAPDMVDEAVERLSRVGEMIGEARSWPELRRRAAAGEWPVEGLDAAGAAWMDDGMFARWVVAGFPLLDDYLAELDRLLPESVVRAVRLALAGWDLLADDAGDQLG